MSLLFDYNRAFRGGKLGNSTEEMIWNFSTNFNENWFLWCGLFLNTRGKLLGQMLGSINEVIGVHHMKLHVFDNNVLITGANLSEDYFTNR